METMIGALLFMFLGILILVAISRWVFRINAIVDRLDSIVHLLRANQTSNVPRK